MLRIFVFSLVFLCGIAYASEPPSPAPSKTGTKPQSQTTTSNNNSATSNNVPQSSLGIIEISPSSVLQIESSEKEEQRHGYSSAEWWLVYVTAGLAAITLGLAIFTACLWLATRRLQLDAKKNNEQQARAFVFLDGFNVELTVATDGNILLEHLPENYRDRPELYITRFAIQPKWKNSGNTPTKKMTVCIDWRVTEGPIAPQYTYRNTPEPFFIAPQAVEPSTFIEIPPGVAHKHINYEMNPRGEHPMLFVWGRADYEDIFGQRHFAEWCYKVRFEDHRGKGLRAGFIQWGDYNHTD